MKLYPRCHPGIIDELKLEKPVLTRGIAYTGTGHLLPCCWCDDVNNKEIYEMGLLDDSMKLENFDSVKDVLISKPWVQFHKTLLIKPEHAPRVCKTKCSLSAIMAEQND